MSRLQICCLALFAFICHFLNSTLHCYENRFRLILLSIRSFFSLIIFLYLCVFIWIFYFYSNLIQLIKKKNYSGIVALIILLLNIWNFLAKCRPLAHNHLAFDHDVGFLPFSLSMYTLRSLKIKYEKSNVKNYLQLLRHLSGNLDLSSKRKNYIV